MQGTVPGRLPAQRAREQGPSGKFGHEEAQTRIAARRFSAQAPTPVAAPGSRLAGLSCNFGPLAAKVRRHHVESSPCATLSEAGAVSTLERVLGTGGSRKLTAHKESPAGRVILTSKISNRNARKVEPLLAVLVHSEAPLTSCKTRLCGWPWHKRARTFIRAGCFAGGDGTDDLPKQAAQICQGARPRDMKSQPFGEAASVSPLQCRDHAPELSLQQFSVASPQLGHSISTCLALYWTLDGLAQPSSSALLLIPCMPPSCPGAPAAC